MKPATPLSWKGGTNPDDCVPRKRDLEFVVHAANLYPKLVEFIQSVDSCRCSDLGHGNVRYSGACNWCQTKRALLKECQQ